MKVVDGKHSDGDCVLVRSGSGCRHRCLCDAGCCDEGSSDEGSRKEEMFHCRLRRG